MTPGSEITSMILTSCQTNSVQFIAMFWRAVKQGMQHVNLYLRLLHLCASCRATAIVPLPECSANPLPKHWSGPAPSASVPLTPMPSGARAIFAKHSAIV